METAPRAPDLSHSVPSQPRSRSQWAQLLQKNRLALLLGLILTVGCFFRLPPGLFTNGGPLHALSGLHPNPRWYELGWRGIDEGLYSNYVDQLGRVGLGRYPDIVGSYVWKQRQLPGSILPPTRFLYIFTAHLWQQVTHYQALECLRNVASFFSMLTLGMAALMVWRMRGPNCAVAVAALTAFAPTQIHMSQHALVDGFFTFWALLTIWLLWQNLRAPRSWTWLAAYTIAFALLVLTKENSFFVWIGLLFILMANRWLKFGSVTPHLLIATLAGPFLGVMALAALTGSVGHLIITYRLLVAKNYALEYAILTGDGPWNRYLIDLLLVSPIVVVLAVGAVFRLKTNNQPEWFFVVFVAGTYLIMCNVKYGMNLRYANMWDVPLRFLALTTMVDLSSHLRQRRTVILTAMVALLCVLEFRQYLILFVQYPLQELITDGLLRALSILK